MVNETKSKKYIGVYIRFLDDSSKTFYIVYKHPITKKTTRLKIGNSKDGFNEAYCNNKRIEIISKLRLGEDPNIPILKHKQSFLCLNDISIKYFEAKAIESSKQSIYNRKSRYQRHYSEDMGLLSLHTINKNHCLNLQKKLLGQDLAIATVNGMLQFGSTLFNFAIEEGLYNSLNPFKGIKQLTVDNSRLRFLDSEEITTLKEYIKSKDDVILYLFVLIAISTGARLSSILNIKKKDISFKQNSINIYDLKNQSNYTGALIDEVKAILPGVTSALNNDDYIISYDKRKVQRRLSPILNKLFNSDLKKDDRINRAVIHTLRHTFASHLVINGVPIYTVQKLMNHKDIKQTMRYAKLSPESGINAVQNIFN